MVVDTFQSPPLDRRKGIINRMHPVACPVLMDGGSETCFLFPSLSRPVSQDQYANYVIQKTLQLAPREAALSLVESIREHLPLMRNSSGGRRMLTKIAKRFPVSICLVGGTGLSTKVDVTDGDSPGRCGGACSRC